MRDALLAVISLAFVVPSRCYGPLGQTQNSNPDVNIITYSSTETNDYGLASGNSFPSSSGAFLSSSLQPPLNEPLVNGINGFVPSESLLTSSSQTPQNLVRYWWENVQSPFLAKGALPPISVSSAVPSSVSPAVELNVHQVDAGTTGVKLSSPGHTEVVYANNPFLNGEVEKKTKLFTPTPADVSSTIATTAADLRDYPKPNIEPLSSNSIAPSAYPSSTAYPSATYPPSTGQSFPTAPSTPYPGCAAALKCVPENYCNVLGFASDTPVVLSKEFLYSRVPLTDCLDEPTGIIGKCCRDPDYKDPWPADLPHEHGHDHDHAHGHEHHPESTTVLTVIPISAYKPPTEQSPKPAGDYGAGSGGVHRPPASSIPSLQPRPSNPPPSILGPSYGQPQQPSVPPFHPSVPPPPYVQPQNPTVPPFHPHPSNPLPSIVGPPYGQPQQPSVPPYNPQSTNPPPSIFIPPSSTYPAPPKKPTYPSSPSNYYQPPSISQQPLQPPYLTGVSQNQPGYPHPFQPSSPPPTFVSSKPSSPPELTIINVPPQYQSSHPPIPPSPPTSVSYPISTQETTITVIKPGYPSSPPPTIVPVPPSTSYPYPSSSPAITFVPSKPTYQPPIPQQPEYPSPPGYPSSPPQYPQQPSYPQQPIPSQYPQQPSYPQAPQYPQQSQYPQPGYYPSNKLSESYTALQETVEVTQAPSKYHIINRFADVCGIKKTDGTAHGYAPWHVIVYSSKNKDLICAGAIVSDNAILTAAHCLDHSEADTTEVKVGPQGTIYRVAAIARHSQYEPISFSHDLALVFLQQPVHFDEYVGKICLPTSFTQTLQNNKKECYVSSMSKDFEENTLEVIPVEVFPYKDCDIKLRNTYLGKYFILNDSFSCVSTPADNELCSVKTGAPIACSRSDGSFQLFGIKSWDLGCQQYKSSAIFSNADVTWIQNMLSTPLPKLIDNEKARRKDKFKGESLEAVNINEKPGFSQGYGK